MPYLMLKFESTREMSSEDLQDGLKKMVPTGREEIKLVMIDADNGRVVELEADAINVKQRERKPTFGETHAASQTLGKGVAEGVSKVDFDRVVKERDSYREKSVSAEKIIRDKDRELDQSTRETKRLRGLLNEQQAKQFGDDDKTLVGAALDNYIEYLLSTNQYQSYQDAKKLFKRVTGTAWLDEGEQDDEEEGDQPQLQKLSDVLPYCEFEFADGWVDFGFTKEKPFWIEEISDPIEDLLRWQEKIRIGERSRKPPLQIDFRNDFQIEFYRDLLYGKPKEQQEQGDFDHLMQGRKLPESVEEMMEQKPQNKVKTHQTRPKRGPKRIDPSKSR